MTAEAFLYSDLVKPKSQTVENLASRIQETNSLPDPYVLRIIDGKFHNLEGVPADRYIEQNSYLGSREIIAFRKIEAWTETDGAEEQTALWFSPPYGHIYPTSKVVISTLSKDEHLLMNRSLTLNLNEADLLALASSLPTGKTLSSEDLRSHPFFITKSDHQKFLDKLSLIDPKQHELITSGKDITLKERTLSEAANIRKTIAPQLIHKNHRLEHIMFEHAKSRGLVGQNSETCPLLLRSSLLSTPLQAFSGEVGIVEGKKFIINCGACKRELKRYMSKGDKCPYCSGTYEGC